MAGIHIRRAAGLWWVALLVLGSGCGDDDTPGEDAGPGHDATLDASVLSDARPGPDAAAPDAGTDPVCTEGDGYCLAYNQRRTCSGGNWQEETCAAGAGCVDGACVSGACSDECRLGDVNGSQTCELYDIGTGQWVTPDPDTSLHDRARAYAEWLHRDGMAFGGVGNARYSDPGTYQTLVSLGGLGDSAIWTGTYLAAEALRLQATGSVNAREHVIDAVETLHLWWNVSGTPGLLARFVAPHGATPPAILGDLDCSADRCHCDVSYDGQSWDYIGHISRDQYQGVMLGYALAYDALAGQGSDAEAARDLIRADVVEFVQELMTERNLPMQVTYNGTTLPQVTVTLRFAVLVPEEMQNGAVQLTVDTNNTGDSEMMGFQEFIPNLAHVVRQLPGLSWVPDIPRAGSGIMLASFFRVAMHVTDGVPGYASQHDTIEDYYFNHSGEGGNASDWLAIASNWSYSGDCGDGYYANNIVMEPMYNLARLETDPTLRATVHNTILNGRLWAEYQNTKNSWFSFIYAGNYTNADSSVAPDAVAQLAGFPSPPRVAVAVDLRNDARYQPHESGCTDQVDHSMAVDVADRVPSDFIWQRHPWGLYAGADLARTYPGVDYLAAYWLGRYHGFITDDTPAQCTAWHTP